MGDREMLLKRIQKLQAEKFNLNVQFDRLTFALHSESSDWDLYELEKNLAITNVLIEKTEIEIENLLEQLNRKAIKDGIIFKEAVRNNDIEIQDIKPPQILLDISQFFIPKNIREAALGDIEEKFKSDVEKNGVQTAKLNLCKNILSSIYPFVWGFVRAKFEKLVGRVER